MKTTKKIFAALLAVMMILVMVPFSASAAEGDISFDLTCSEKGYVFTVYQVATLDKTAGKYTAVSTVSGVADAINDSEKTSKHVLELLDGASTGLGTVVATFDTNTATSATVTAAPGIYYVKATSVPTGIKSSQNSLVVLPQYTTVNGKTDWVNYLDTTNNTSVINLADKYSSSDASSDKNIVLEDGSLVDYSTTGYGETVTFRLEATVMGSDDKPLKTYALVDNMSNDLAFGEITAVYLADANGTKTADITDYTKATSVNGVDYTFAVLLGDTILASGSDFYDAAQVVVEYTATINEDAAVNTAVPNTSMLVYENNEGNWDNTTEVTVNVFTAGMKVYKTDAKTGTALANAVFGVYSDEACTDRLATATTDTTGYGTFMGSANDVYKFATGTYYVKEITAPAGYILSEEVSKVVMTTTANANQTMTVSVTGSDTNVSSAAGGVVQVAAQNSPIRLPATGGMGTMMFTIGGAALIACAGVLLFVLKRKSSAK